jgi:peptidoglycan hydrolase-like protein with peptidoglycan-binding domain
MNFTTYPYDTGRSVLIRVGIFFASLLFLSSAGKCVTVEGPVSAVQNTLKQEKLLLTEPSGVFDEATQAALRRFQLRHSLVVTGQIDSATLEALQKSSTSQAPVSNRPPLPEAVVAEDRQFLQNLENGNGLTHGPAEGPIASDQMAPAPLAAKGRPVDRAQPPMTAAPRTESGENRGRKSGSSNVKTTKAPQEQNDPAPNPAATQPARHSPVPTKVVTVTSDADEDSPPPIKSDTRVTQSSNPKRIVIFGAPPSHRDETDDKSRDNGFLHRLFHHD